MTPEQALQNLHNCCEEFPCKGRERDALRQSAQTLAAFIKSVDKIKDSGKTESGSVDSKAE